MHACGPVVRAWGYAIETRVPKRWDIYAVCVPCRRSQGTEVRCPPHPTRARGGGNIFPSHHSSGEGCLFPPTRAREGVSSPPTIAGEEGVSSPPTRAREEEVKFLLTRAGRRVARQWWDPAFVRLFYPKLQHSRATVLISELNFPHHIKDNIAPYPSLPTSTHYSMYPVPTATSTHLVWYSLGTPYTP